MESSSVLVTVEWPAQEPTLSAYKPEKAPSAMQEYLLHFATIRQVMKCSGRAAEVHDLQLLQIFFDCSLHCVAHTNCINPFRTTFKYTIYIVHFYLSWIKAT
jgi:hypothetical protein